MIRDIDALSRFPLPSLDEQANLVERHRADTLLFCPDAWALRHVFINQDTGEVVRARCNRWDCLYCGPRKVDQWRQLVKAAEPTLFLTLTKAGKTVEEAARALTTFLQYLRRGSKGRGPNHIGAREAYPVEYFAVLERHTDFEENGFHWHLLVKGTDFIPHEILKEAWRSARHGEAYIVHVEAVRKPHVIGYVTKYLTKSLSCGEKGVRTTQRSKRVTVREAVDSAVNERGNQYLYIVHQDEQGNVVEEQEDASFESMSKARRIRYSRHFFPEKVTELRARLFTELEQEAMEQTEQQAAPESVQLGDGSPTQDSSIDGTSQPENNSKPREDEQPKKRSSWSLVQREEFTQDIQEYRRRRRKALLEALIDIRMGRQLSRRVINIWAYQRSTLRWAS